MSCLETKGLLKKAGHHTSMLGMIACDEIDCKKVGCTTCMILTLCWTIGKLAFSTVLSNQGSPWVILTKASKFTQSEVS